MTVLLFGVGIYKYQWRGAFVRALAHAVPYPAVLVDWEPVRYWTYLDDLAALEHYWETQRGNANVFLGIPDRNEIRERLMNKLIEERIVSQSAREKGITVSNDEVGEEWGRLLAKPDAEREIESFILDAYGWDEKTFKERVLIPFLMRRKLAGSLAAESGANEDALEARAEELYARVRTSSADFDTLAQDLGYFGRGTFEPQLEEAIFLLEMGQMSEPIRSSSGYHIVRLDDKLTDESGLAVQAAAHQILVKSFDFEAWLESKKREAAIYRLVQ